MAKTQILILGGGFGGLYVARRLDRTLARDPDCEVTLIDKQNFTLFTPMLHEVVSSDLDPTDIVNPLRKMLRNITFYEATVEKIDLHARRVTVCFGLSRRCREFAYDHLVIAFGAQTRFFDDQTRDNAAQLKSLGDAMFLRNRMIGLLEAASVEEDPRTKARLLTFVVAGGGFAGVESIGAMNDFLRNAMRFYPRIDPKLLKVVLVHPGNVLLPEFAPSLGRYTGDRLREAGIDVRLDTSVESFDGQTVVLKLPPPPEKNPDYKPPEQADPAPRSPDRTNDISARTLLWTAGVTPPPIVQQLPMKKEKGRLVVAGTMQSEEFPGVWAVGDCAHIPDPATGKPFPATAQHATREGTRLAKNIEAAVRGTPQKPFTFHTLGQLAAIGRRRGAANILGVNFSGFFAWFLWRGIYLAKLPRLEKKIRVGIAWALDLVFSRDLVQIITTDDVQRLAALGMRYRLVNGQLAQGSPMNGEARLAGHPAAAGHGGPSGDFAPHHPLAEPVAQSVSHTSAEAVS